MSVCLYCLSWPRSKELEREMRGLEKVARPWSAASLGSRRDGGFSLVDRKKKEKKSRLDGHWDTETLFVRRWIASKRKGLSVFPSWLLLLDNTWNSASPSRIPPRRWRCCPPLLFHPHTHTTVIKIRRRGNHLAIFSSGGWHLTNHAGITHAHAPTLWSPDGHLLHSVHRTLEGNKTVTNK